MKNKPSGNNTFKYTKSTKRRLVLVFSFLLLFGVLFWNKLSFNDVLKINIKKYFSGNNPISTVEITTDDYNQEGSIKLTKEAHWINKTEAELDLSLETIRKTGDNKKDIVLVFDVSGSMEGEKLDKVKQDASELIEYVLDKDEDNKVGLITFASESRIISPLTNNKEELLTAINNMSTEDATNYYLAYKDIETILDGYSKESGKDLVVLFMTDGVPTDGTSAQGVYESLKEQYPYITINSIEYEKGKTASDTVGISDNQWVADMNTLNNTLFEATVNPETYERLKIIDYIDDEYFEIETNTPSKGSINVDNNKITWRFSDNSYVTGSKESLKIKLKLKDEYKNIKGLYSTNKKTEIEYKIDEAKEKVSTLSPILKNNYDVIYDINAPETCNLEDPESENHFIFDTVTINNIEPKCTGYQLKGWKLEETDVKFKSEDTFVMPEHDVHIRAIWSKQTMKAYMDGTVHEKTTLYKTIENDDVKSGDAKLYTGEHQDSLEIEGTENIYYYNDDISTNNVIFANFCWQIIRTTDTGGIKIIYNGVPSPNGICNNLGADQQIGTSKFNNNSNSLGYAGYMYNDIYPHSTHNFSPSTNLLSRIAINKTHYFSKNYEYNQSVANRYKLYDDPETVDDERFTAAECISNGNCNEILKGTYTFSSANPDYNNPTIRYVAGVVGEYIYYLSFQNGEILDDVNPTFYTGNNYSKIDDNQYLIETNNEEDSFKKEDWVNKYSSIKNKYLCIGSNPCNNPLFITNTAVLTYNAESLTDNYVFANDFDYELNQETGEYEYVLKDTNISNKMNIWDWHSKYNQIKNNHYTCFNTTGRCKSLYYIFVSTNTVGYYILLNNGIDINTAVNNMLKSDNVNTNDSVVKTYLENWYYGNLLDYDNYLENVIYCNDRSINDLAGWNPNGGALTSYLYFNAYNVNRKQLKCTNETDKFQVNHAKANLNYPIGLITSDEAALAKGNSSYLKTGSTNILTSNPSQLTNEVRVRYINYTGDINGNYYSTNYTYAIRPVISLKPEIEYTAGDGTKNNPYIIDTTE